MNINTAITEYNNMANQLHMDDNHHIHGLSDLHGLRVAKDMGRLLSLDSEALIAIESELKHEEEIEGGDTA